MTDEVNIPNYFQTSSVTALTAVTPSHSGEGFIAVVSFAYAKDFSTHFVWYFVPNKVWSK
jgi:hypothetical protein